MAISSYLGLLAAVSLIVYWVTSWGRRGRRPPGARPLPGPWGLPYIGRVHDIPSKASWVKFYDWSKEYGPIYQTRIFGTTHVWISMESVAQELLAKRSTIYSDRPMIPNLPDNRTSGEYLALLGHTDTWKHQRKLCNGLMHASNLASLHSYPTVERDRFLYLLCLDPANYIEWIEQFTGRTISWLCWGTASPAQVLRHTTFGLLETISPAGSLPNMVTFLRHVPRWMSPWKKKEQARHQLEGRLFRANVDHVTGGMDLNHGHDNKDRNAKGDGADNPAKGEPEVPSENPHPAEPSFIRTFFETKSSPDERVRARWGEPSEASHVVGLMAIAGALTIGSPIQSYILAMCHFPEWQTELQKEIDEVLGGRCPKWEDRAELPLLRAVVKEVIRWRPPVPTGIPHASERDDVYEGYHIPAGATIHALEWGITRDESKYPEAETFNPYRWIDPSSPVYREPLTEYPRLSGFSQFGFGRRTCQGIPIVEQDLFLTMGGMAWAFNIGCKKDPVTGEDIPVHWDDYTPLLIAKPTPFDFQAVPRSRAKVDAMRAMYRDAMRELEGKRGGEMDVGAFYKDLGEQVYADDVLGEKVTSKGDAHVVVAKEKEDGEKKKKKREEKVNPPPLPPRPKKPQSSGININTDLDRLDTGTVTCPTPNLTFSGPITPVTEEGPGTPPSGEEGGEGEKKCGQLVYNTLERAAASVDAVHRMGGRGQGLEQRQEHGLGQGQGPRFVQESREATEDLAIETVSSQRIAWLWSFGFGLGFLWGSGQARSEGREMQREVEGRRLMGSE